MIYFTPEEQGQFAFAAAGSTGTSARNNFRGPGFYNLDLALSKKIALTEQFKLGFRIEMFHTLNEANFDNPNYNFSAPNSFGRITTLVNGN